MDGEPPRDRDLLIGGGPDQRVPELDRGADPDESPRLRRLEVGQGETEAARDRGEQAEARSVVGRRHRQGPPGRLRQQDQLGPEVLLQPADRRQRRHRWRVRPVGILRRQLDDRQRVTGRLPQHPLDGGVRQGPDLGQQPGRLIMIEPAQLQVVDPVGPERPITVAGGEDHRHRIGLQPADREQQRGHRRPVEPVRVVEQAEQRPLLGELRQQGQRRRPDQ